MNIISIRKKILLLKIISLKFKKRSRKCAKATVNETKRGSKHKTLKM